jgi:hypothetical protein
MPEELVVAFQGLLFAVISAVIVLATFAAKRLIVVGQLYLEQKLGAATYGFLKDYATTTVRFLAQQPALKELAGEEKKQMAVAEIVAWCQSKGIPLDPPLIDKLIEEAVNIMFSEKPEPPLMIGTVQGPVI